MFKKGKKTKEWDRVRKQLVAKFQEAGISYCEVMWDTTRCWRNIGLGFAHIDKRRHLEEGEIYSVVLACPYCHNVIEALPRNEMRNIIQDIIDRRQVPIDSTIKNNVQNIYVK